MRGKVPCLVCSLHTSRITPAYAGKSLFSSVNLRMEHNHPRLCGEKPV